MNYQLDLGWCGCDICQLGKENIQENIMIHYLNSIWMINGDVQLRHDFDFSASTTPKCTRRNIIQSSLQCCCRSRIWICAGEHPLIDSRSKPESGLKQTNWFDDGYPMFKFMFLNSAILWLDVTSPKCCNLGFQQHISMWPSPALWFAATNALDNLESWKYAKYHTEVASKWVDVTLVEMVLYIDLWLFPTAIGTAAGATSYPRHGASPDQNP